MAKETSLEDVLDVIEGFCGDLNLSKQESKDRYDAIWEHCETASAALEDEIAEEENDSGEDEGFEGEDGG